MAQKEKKKAIKKYHHGDLKNALLRSSVQLLKSNGPQSFSIRELALSLGVSSAAPYRHFKTKEKIFAGLAEEGFVLLSKGFEDAIRLHPKSPIDQLHSVGVAYYRFAVQNPEYLQMMFGNIIPPEEISKDPKMGEAAGRAFKLLVQVVASCQAHGDLAKKEDPKMLAILIWSSIHGFAALDSTATLTGASGLNYRPEDLVVRISKAMSMGLNKN